MKTVKKIFSRLGRILLSLFETIVIFYVICVTSIILFRNKFGYTQYGNYTISSVKEENVEFIPNSKLGDLLVVKNAGAIQKGDLIYYYMVVNNNYSIRTGVVGECKGGGDAAIYNLTDGNTVINDRVLGKYSSLVHGLGYVISILVSKIGFLLLVLLPIMIIFIHQIYDFIIVFKYGYQDDDINQDALVKESISKKKDDVELL